MERVRDKWENKKKEEELEKLRKKEIEMKKNYFEYLKYCEENKNNTKNNPPLESQDPTQKSQIDLDKIINQASIIPKANANMKFFQNTKIKTYMTQLDQKYDFQKMPLIYSQNSKKPKRNPKRKCLNLNPLPRAHPTASSRSKTRYNPHLSINPSSPNPPSFTPTQSFSTPNSPHLLSKFQNPSARTSLQPCIQNPHLHSQLDHDHGHNQEEELNVDLTELERTRHILEKADCLRSQKVKTKLLRKKFKRYSRKINLMNCKMRRLVKNAEEAHIKELGLPYIPIKATKNSKC
ncbi:unnamed protein product [Moneuplotes crassus]|uniref:Uncharacterized protein n=1 Tax=Euplotes crassus TaxID=5936 RepID=A0AAD1X6K7_EUPCR|nr:unnamed protein product [Moneuplotes crassus]